ncbi:purine-cytosine permease (NCS1 nucleoside transporter) [Colletotrichum truncatum]|uniref:Purine-cytosine permease (NCS1 nucleoside transporter) n=1 Tax=Colletotrichum truncatum TaxID=5467 RepID=A0ACC3YU05_COLTU|nr:purine-cytosine permease (NCS1 nucleoside transporter) [Colletotrichum truncatum]KAF6798551.1 purine-cytosine permease (NCS1 nucleoside transporter) [Colletotrichum truncatum]
MAIFENKSDVESNGEKKDTARGYVGTDINSQEDFATGTTTYAKLQRLAGKFGVEQRGIERVPEDERTNDSLSMVGTLWCSANMVVSSFAIGALATPVFDLGYVDTALTIIFFNFLGVMPVCFFSTFGPKFGLRQMVLSRFWYGFYGVKLIAIFNVLACLGWSAVNVIVGAQLFHAVNEDMPGWAGILVIAISTLIICTFGYRIVHAYERYSWIPCTIIFLIVLGVFAHSGKFNNMLPLKSGPAEAGSILSFAASVYGFATGWTSYSADYTCYYPASTPRTRVFIVTFSGLFFTLCFTELLGAAIMTASVLDPTFSDAYSRSGIGGLLSSVLVPRLGGFGQFCLVILALSIIANNCPNIYSVSLTLQVLSKRTERVPRWVWVFAGTAVYVAISIPGYDRFEAWLENFMLIIAYWLAIYTGISVTEHFVFRRGLSGYNLEDHETPSRLPPGFAAVTAFLIGVMGAVLGMSQTWFTGPIGKLAGGARGGDIGFELGFSFASASYTVLRTVEKRFFKR